MSKILREFNVIPHGAGKNFLGALQDVIKGVETVKNIEKQIKINNLFDEIYDPFHFNNNYKDYDKTQWDNTVSQKYWSEGLKRKKSTAKKEIIEHLKSCYKGTHHLGYSLPSIPHYGIICILDSVEQRIDLDLLANIKKKNKCSKEKIKDVVKEGNLIHSWEIENMNNYKADYTYDYTSLFHELDPRIITEIVERTEDAFKVKSPVTIADITTLIAKYNKRNQEILYNLTETVNE